MRRRNALVLGDDTRSFLAIVRSLGRQGIEVHAAPLDFGAPALRSHYLAATHYLPLWVGDGAAWLDAMEALLRAQPFDVVIPCTEIGLLPLARHRDRFAPLTCLAIPHDDAIAVLFDKHATRELAASLGIPVPPGRLLSADDSAPTIVAAFGTPVMLKPRRSYTLDTLDSRGKVHTLRSPAEVAARLPQSGHDAYLLERFFPGRGVGVSVLASEGELLQAFQHHRVHENHGGGSYYRVSATPDPALVQACAAMMRAVRYTGVAMFEFRRNATEGAWQLLEVNARPWGSLPLPVALGVDFPFRWYRLLIERQTTPSVAYQAGIYGRNLLPDLADLAEVVQDAGAPGMVFRRLIEFGRALTRRERQDTLAPDDLRPGLAEIGMALAGLLARVAYRLPGARRIRAPVARRRLARALAAANGGTPHVLFVCAGNICRSPYAAAALARFHPEIASRIETGSAGTLPRTARPTTDAGLFAANARDIDLRGHRSRHLSREMASAATVILVFDEQNRRAVIARHPGVHERVVMLGELAEFDTIADPFGGNQSTYLLCYDKIDKAVSALAERLRQVPKGELHATAIRQ